MLGLRTKGLDSCALRKWDDVKCTEAKEEGVLVERNTFLHFDQASEASTIASRSERKGKARTLSWDEPAYQRRGTVVKQFRTPEKKEEIREVLSAPSRLDSRFAPKQSGFNLAELADEDLSDLDCDLECFAQEFDFDSADSEEPFPATPCMTPRLTPPAQRAQAPPCLQAPRLSVPQPPCVPERCWSPPLLMVPVPQFVPVEHVQCAPVCQPQPQPRRPSDPRFRMLGEHIHATMRERRMLQPHLVVDVYMEVWEDLCGEPPAFSSRAQVDRFRSILEASPDLFEVFHASVGISVPNGKEDMMVRLVTA